MRSNPDSSPIIYKDKEKGKDEAKRKEEMKMLKGHIENLEHLLFVAKSQNLELKWVLSSYHLHSKIGQPVYSPIFYTQLQGYRFQLAVNWQGAEKGSLEVYLYLRYGKSHNTDVKALNVP